jgi:hypothetical protein
MEFVHDHLIETLRHSPEARLITSDHTQLPTDIIK